VCGIDWQCGKLAGKTQFQTPTGFTSCVKAYSCVETNKKQSTNQGENPSGLHAGGTGRLKGETSHDLIGDLGGIIIPVAHADDRYDNHSMLYFTFSLCQ